MLTPEEDNLNMRTRWAALVAAEEAQKRDYKQASEMLERAKAARDAALTADMPLNHTVQDTENWNTTARYAQQEFEEAQAGADILRKDSRDTLKLQQLLHRAAMEETNQTEMEFDKETGEVFS